jgi:hypothetical protein
VARVSSSLIRPRGDKAEGMDPLAIQPRTLDGYLSKAALDVPRPERNGLSQDLYPEMSKSQTSLLEILEKRLGETRETD